MSKICTICGIDVNGKPRVKDHDGNYYCLPCDEAQKQQRQSAQSACPDCGRFFPKDKLETHGGQLVCQGCVRKRREKYQKTKSRMAALGAADAKQRAKQIQIVGGAALVLLVMILVWMALR
jgi:hypothetical protein